VPSGFYALIAAQFVSGLADNALLIVTIARLAELGAPLWWAPLLKLSFTVAFVLLAPFVGALADRWPKHRVMFAANALKAFGCALIVLGGNPLLAFGVAGIGAAVYSPAKYGLVTELVPAERLVAANAWIEICSVGSVLLGTGVGGALVSPWAASEALWPLPLGTEAGTRLGPALLALLALYALAGAINLRIPASGAHYPRVRPLPGLLLRAFLRDSLVLWRDAPARVSLAVTMLFWGVGASLQLIVLRWAEESLGLGLHQGAMLQAASAAGVIAGAALAGRCVALERATAVLPLGIAMGLLVPWMTSFERVGTALPLLVAVGASAGFFVVPMNALLQHRGHRLLSAGRSIAVQNFSENLGVIVLLAAYAGLGAAGLPLAQLIWCLGLFVAATMAVLTVWQRRSDAALAVRVREGT
jgi:LPLT family lysophospholipid transporter-like MFS transporter